MEKTQEQVRQEILDLVADYCKTYHINNKKKYEPGDRIPYASRVSDVTELVNWSTSPLCSASPPDATPMSLRQSWQSIWVCVTVPW